LVDVKNSHRLWSGYYDAFPYFSVQNVRPGCHPRKLIHDNGTGKAIVLIHGLSDSPFFMAAIAEYFHNVLGYNVYLPLIQSHGLKHPDGMAGVSLVEWKKNVHFALQTAAADAERVSIGGLSMGGALGFLFGCSDLAVTGDIYLFSAAFGLYTGSFGFSGWLRESFLRSGVTRFLKTIKSLNGNNPYRYNRISINSAVELVRLIDENNTLLREIKNGRVLDKRIFSTWSEFDKVVSIKAIQGLERIIPGTAYTPYTIPKAACVDHACIVLKESVYAIGAGPEDKPLEVANPLFDEMMAAVSVFESEAS